MSEPCLNHSGIKGMRWGVRRTRKELGYRDATKPKPQQTTKSVTAQDNKKTSSGFKGKKIQEPQKKLSDLSDTELKAVVNRLQLEQQYSKLKPEHVSTGKKVVNTLLKDVLLPSAIEVGKNVTKQALDQAMKNLQKDMAKKAGKKLASMM